MFLYIHSLMNKCRTKSSWIIGWKLSTLDRCSSTEKQIILHIILYQFQISYWVRKYFRINWKVKTVKNYFFFYTELCFRSESWLPISCGSCSSFCAETARVLAYNSVLWRDCGDTTATGTLLLVPLPRREKRNKKVAKKPCKIFNMQKKKQNKSKKQLNEAPNENKNWKQILQNKSELHIFVLKKHKNKFMQFLMYRYLKEI